MKTVKLKFKELELIRTDLSNNNIYLAVHYEEDKQLRRIDKIFNIDANIPDFAKSIIKDIKDGCKKNHILESQEDLDFLSGIVNVIIEEHEPGFSEIRLIDAIRRIKDKIYFFKKNKNSDKYMSTYHDLNETRIRL